MLSSAQSDSNNLREWKVEFSDGRLVNVSGATSRDPNCVENTCGDYFALNGYEAKTLPNSGSFATLGIKKSISKVSGFGNNNPEIRGEGAVNILFCSNVKKDTERKVVNNNSWGSDVCQDQWKIVKDGRKTGGSSNRNGLGWYIIGFIWDTDTQYFGFINEKNLFSKVLNEKLTGEGIDVDAGKTSNTGLFAGTFTGLLDKNIGNVKCLHLNWSKDQSDCREWQAWDGVITMPMGYIGKETIKNKTLKEAALVVVPVDQIRVKDGKLRIGKHFLFRAI